MEFTIIAIISLWAAYLLDLIWGDPEKLPHPIILFGKLISFAEKRFNNQNYTIIKGGIIVLVYCTFCYITFYLIKTESRHWHWSLYLSFNIIFIFYGLANTTLVNEGRMIFNALHTNGLEAGRKQLSRIVGRDTSQLTEQQIRIATLESMAENLSDGVVAPLFYWAIAGVPGMMTYKLINTFDSMIGYKNERYYKFGRIAARLDDVANFIPARITAILMLIVSGKITVYKTIIKFGRAHKSPNSGYPESALAGILSCQFGGPNYYHGQLVDKPFIGFNARTIEHEDFRKAARINHGVCALSILLISVTLWIIA